jgi:hypothetical protein
MVAEQAQPDAGPGLGNRYVTVYNRRMALSHAERQRRYRERRKAQQPPVHYRRPRDRRSRPQRWMDAVETLRELQEEYQEWLDNLPESLQSTALAEKLDEVCSLDLEQLDLDLPRGFGRD